MKPTPIHEVIMEGFKEAWTCGNCKYFIDKKEVDQTGKPTGGGECHQGTPVCILVEGVILKGTMGSPVAVKQPDVAYKLIPQLVWMFTRTASSLIGCSKFKVKEKSLN